MEKIATIHEDETRLGVGISQGHLAYFDEDDEGIYWERPTTLNLQNLEGGIAYVEKTWGSKPHTRIEWEL